MSFPDSGVSLLSLLRECLGIRSVKDGCSPQGQCGACTVLVDGAPRVSCVTPARRVSGRDVTTLEGLGDDALTWAEAFCATGASQCGFCTPGIILRLEGLRRRSPDGDPSRALAAHLCRCTGWQTIAEAWRNVAGSAGTDAIKATAPLAQSPLNSCPDERPRAVGARPNFLKGAQTRRRDFQAAARRAELEGRCRQAVGVQVALGMGGFAEDCAPVDALVAVPTTIGGWALGESLSEARAAAATPGGRRSGMPPTPPLKAPPGEWACTLSTCWVEPAYLELDSSWCLPGGEPASPLANGGAFGGKRGSEVQAAARRLADETGRAVRVVYPREEATRLGAKRPPVAGGANPDGTGVLLAARTPGLAAAVSSVAPGLEMRLLDLPGPPTTMHARAAGVAEAVALIAGAEGKLSPVTVPGGGEARAWLRTDGTEEVIEVEVRCGDPIDEVVLRSYCIGAAHMGYSLVTSEAVAVSPEGHVADLTIRSFGVVPAARTPRIEVRILPSEGEPVNGSDSVFVATVAATWLARGCPPRWPTDR